ncbi:MAG: GNAT family N-acetyltransferase [Pseudomonadota bacterium]
MPVNIDTARLRLRPFHADDMPSYLDYYTSDARTKGVGGAQPKDVAIERFLAMAGQWSIRGYGRYAITTDHAKPAFGHVGVLHLDSEPEMTWTLWDETETQKGFATEAASAVLEAWFAAGAKRIIAPISKNNEPSINVARKLGMEQDPNAVAPKSMPDGIVYAKELPA